MITSKQIIKLSEEYVAYMGTSWSITPIYKNPTVAEVSELYKNSKSKDVRFILDNNTKTVYMWDANTIFHTHVADNLHLNIGLPFSFSGLLPGTGPLKAGKSIMESSDLLVGVIDDASKHKTPDNYNYKLLQLIIKINWSWANRYVDCIKFIEYLKKILK